MSKVEAMRLQAYFEDMEWATWSDDRLRAYVGAATPERLEILRAGGEGVTRILMQVGAARRVWARRQARQGTPLDQQFEFTLRVRAAVTDPHYQLSAEADGSVLIVDDEHGDADEPGMERLTPQAFAEQVAGRLVGFDFDGMWRVVDVRPEAIR